ncbi:MAG: amidase [Propionibacteriales bacterium]|nr:amidase [Propionibacteriales bacterium]
MQLHDLTALEQGAAVRRGEVSPVELCTHYLDRVERLSDDLGAFITVTRERALEQARLAERRVSEWRGSGDLDEVSPLYGVPTAIKDLNPTAGVRTTFGSAVYDEFVPDESDELVLRMERAGMISLGKTNTPEFGSPCYTEPAVAPPARTPYDPARSAGGSSGGSAAAVAGGLVPMAQGSDGAGSIRIPASMCGLVGLKPSRGRISTAPTYADITGLGVSGPLARTVRDAAAFLDAVAGPAAGDPYEVTPVPETGLRGWCDREPGSLRIARFDAPVIIDTPVHPDCLRAYERASDLLESLGHEVVEVDRPFAPDVIERFEPVWFVSTALSVVPPEREHLLRPLTRWLIELGNEVDGPAFAAWLIGLRQSAAAARRALREYDAVLTPTLAQPPLPVGALRNDEDPAADFEAQKRFTPFTMAWNATGMPAFSLPLHWNDDGLPIGVMLAGRAGEEHVLCSLAAQVEAAAPWHDHHPPCW